VDLTPEIKISENVLSLFGALYIIRYKCFYWYMVGNALQKRLAWSFPYQECSVQS